MGFLSQNLLDYVLNTLISKEDWIELLMSKNEVTGGHIRETTLAGPRTINI